MDKDMIALLDGKPKTTNFPEDCVPTPAQVRTKQ